MIKFDGLTALNAAQLAKVKTYLTSIGARGANMLGVLQNGALTGISVEVFLDNPDNPKGVALRITYPRLRIYLCCEDPLFGVDFIKSHPVKEILSFSGVEKRVAERMQQELDLQRASTCDCYCYPHKTVPHFDSPYSATEILQKDIETVNSFYTYRGEYSLAQITEEVTHRPTSAVYINGEIVCWSLVHFDNSMGTMFTRPEFRKLGLATVVSERLIKCLIERDILPFVHIETANTASKALGAKNQMVHFGQCDFFGGTVK